MAVTRLDEAVDLLIQILPIMRRRMHREVFGKVLEEIGEGMGPHHLMIMKVLHEGGPLHVAEVGEEIAVSKPQMTHSADKLIGLGMINRRSDADDRRRIIISLTKKGEDTIKRIEQIIRSRVRAKLGALSDAELDKLTTSLRGLAEVLGRMDRE
jgi:DNA-binding MarR family transcriptional regulator